MKKILVVLLGFLLVQSACKRSSDVLGPAACPSESFAVTAPLEVKDNASSSTTNLNLSTSYANITASFNEVISYRLTLVGQTSDAKFVLDGKGNAIAYAWYGNSTNGKYFKQGEVVSYKLTNLCKTEPLGMGQITITTIIGYNGFGLKLANFEDGPATSSYGDCFAGVCAASGLKTPADPDYTTASPQGGNYFHYEASCTNNPSGVAWYFGGMDFNGVNYTSLGTDPSRVYLNFFAKGQANSQAQFIIKETLYGSTLSRKFLANVSDNGWTLYSVKLSDIGVIDPSKITTVSFNLGAAAFQDASAVVDLDLVLFTLDKPF